MLSPRVTRQLALVFCVLATVLLLCTGMQAAEYKPEVGQAGKDVIWVPTSQALIAKMLDMAKLAPEDYLIDLGSGDGRTVIAAAKRGANARGIEYNPNMVALSERNAAAAGVSSKAVFENADLYKVDLSKATVITMFLLPEINLNLRPRLLELKPGTRIVSNSFDMGDWEPDQTASVDDNNLCQDYCTAYLWIVPARVDGAWELPDSRLTVQQNFQKISGSLKQGDKNAMVEGRLYGDRITFRVGETVYTGRVAGNTMSGSMKSGDKTTEWKANRLPELTSASGGK